MTSPRTPRQLLGWTVPDHVMSFDVAPNELTLWCFKHEPRVGSGRITRDPEHRPDQIIDFLKAHAHGETVEYRPNLDPDVSWPLSEVLPETPEPTGAQGCNAQSSWNGNHEIKYCARPVGHPGEHRSSLVSEWDTLKWHDDDDPVPASQSVPAVPVSSTGGKETGEAAEGGTGVLSGEPSARQAGEALRLWHGTLYKAEESEYDHGYRVAYERIVDWLEHEFPAIWAAGNAPQQGEVTS